MPHENKEAEEKPPVTEKGGLKLVWSDEFDKDGLPDYTKWGYNLGGNGWGNKAYNHLDGTQKSDTLRVPDCSSAFHVYALDWSADSIKSFVDDKQYFSFANDHSGHDAWPFDDKMYLILNLAIGGSWGGAKGVDDTIFPQRMEVDYVRVYQK